ncbi:MAG: acyl-CoA dehydrogenase, partial [Dermatophilaceae bacterium]
LGAAADSVDEGSAKGAAGARLALTVRQVVRHSAEEVLTEAAHAMGPAPLVRDEEHARRVADLQVYVRQEHAARDAAALGRAVLEGGP